VVGHDEPGRWPDMAVHGEALMTEMELDADGFGAILGYRWLAVRAQLGEAEPVTREWRW
jgi:hypothetical protein